MFARKLISCLVRGEVDPFIKRSETSSVGLPQTVCAFACGLSGEEILVFVLPFKDDA